MLKATHCTQLWTKCLECDVPILNISHEHIYTVEHIDRQVQSVTEPIHSGMKILCTPQHCTMCGGQMDICNSFLKAPKIISVILNTNFKMTIDKTVKIMNQNGGNTILNLRGLVYFENFHFVCGVVSMDERIWYNDGKTMGHISTIDGTLQSVSNDNLWHRGSKVLVVAIYAQT